MSLMAELGEGPPPEVDNSANDRPAWQQNRPSKFFFSSFFASNIQWGARKPNLLGIRMLKSCSNKEWFCFQMPF